MHFSFPLYLRNSYNVTHDMRAALYTRILHVHNYRTQRVRRDMIDVTVERSILTSYFDVPRDTARPSPPHRINITGHAQVGSGEPQWSASYLSVISGSA